MILEVIRMVADALGHDEYGVNAKIAALPVDEGDSAPSTVVTIADETRNGDVARGRFPSGRPCLTVMLHQSVELDPEKQQGIRDGEVDVVIRMVVEDVESENGNRDTYYVLRAVKQTIAAFMDNANVADRSRNDIQIKQVLGMQAVTQFQRVEDGIITAAIVLKLAVRDIQP